MDKATLSDSFKRALEGNELFGGSLSYNRIRHPNIAEHEKMFAARLDTWQLISKFSQLQSRTLLTDNSENG